MDRFWRFLHFLKRKPTSAVGWLLTVVEALAVAALGGLAVWGYILMFPGLPSPVKMYDVVKLNKSWTDEERQFYYHTSQGSQIMPYDWFIALEQPNSKQLFTSNDYITKMRVIPDPNPVHNPDLLPIGLAKDDPDPITGVQNVGFTCAFCHTAQITYHGMGIRIDGAPGIVNFDTLLAQIVLSVAATVQPGISATLFDPGKFDRFARRVLKDKYSPAAAEKLRSEVRSWLADKVKERADELPLKSTTASFGRLDALGTGGNTLYRRLAPGNLRALNAPVTAFPLWYVTQYDWVQSNGSIRQPMSRNIIESVAVNASMILPGDPAKNDRYISSIRMKYMWQMEDLAGKLEAPVWPEWILGPINQDKAAKGKVLYGQYCSKCHSPQLEPAPLCGDEIAIRNKKRYFMLRLYSIDEIGTDPLDALNFATRTADASSIGLGKNAPGPEVIQTVIGGLLRRGFKDLNLSQATEDEWSGYRSDCLRAPKAYPARPLDGVWATGPFLHNKSVASLYELLLPAEQRLKKLHVGDPEFDPVNVGYVNTEIPGGFTLDTSKPGNSNSGHEFRSAPAGTKGVIGPELTDEQRWEIVEYMKIIDEMGPAMAAAKNQPASTQYGACWTDPQYGACNAAPPTTQSSTPSPASPPTTGGK